MTRPLQGVNEDLLLPREDNHLNNLVVQSDHLLEAARRDLPATDMRMRIAVPVPDGPLVDALAEEVPHLDVAATAELSHMNPNQFLEHSPKESPLFVTLCLTLLP
jgi:hypothetical protein